MGEFVATVLKEGAIAFIGCKITKVLGQKEISEMISATGWCIVGIEFIQPAMNMTKWVNDKISEYKALVEATKSLPEKLNPFKRFMPWKI